MTRDDLRFDDDLPHARREEESSRPPVEREVPLRPPPAAIAAGVHAWLDGETSESSARRGPGAQDVELWTRLRHELAGRRRTRAPAGFVARVAAAIAQLPA